MQCTSSGFSQFNSLLAALRNTHGDKSLMMFKAFLHKTYSAEIETKAERYGGGRRKKVELKVQPKPVWLTG